MGGQTEAELSLIDSSAFLFLSETVLEVCNKGVCLPSASQGEGPGVRFCLRFDPIPGPSPSEGEGRIAFLKQILRRGVSHSGKPEPRQQNTHNTFTARLKKNVVKVMRAF